MIAMKNSIENDTYIKLMEYLTGKCSCMNFAVPDYSRFPPNQRSSINTAITKTICEVQKEYGITDYKKKVYPVLEELRPFVIEQCKGWGSFLAPGGVYFDEYTVACNETVLNVLKSKNGIKDWDFPFAPMDLSFFIDKTWFFTTQGRCCRFHIQDQAEYNFLKNQIGIRFYNFH